MPLANVRVARPTDRLAEVVAFYRDGVGLAELGGFRGHAGYDGVFLGLPGAGHHLEFTSHVAGSPCPAPTRENLLVLYYDSAQEREAVVARLRARGEAVVEPDNPYWTQIGALTFEDPDGWRVVLAGAPWAP